MAKKGPNPQVLGKGKGAYKREMHSQDAETVATDTPTVSRTDPEYWTHPDRATKSDIIYFPQELYEILRDVWMERKKKKSSAKKSHMVIEALLLHPEVQKRLSQ
jgi:hypothetical protein